MSIPIHHTPIGDHGQRYEVRARESFSNREFVVGWTNVVDGGELAKMVEGHPSWHGLVVVDRWKGQSPT